MLKDSLESEIASLDAMPWLTPYLSRLLNALRAALVVIEEGRPEPRRCCRMVDGQPVDCP